MDYFLQIQISVLRELISKKKFGGSHISIQQKRTGKGSDNHISINPRSIRDIMEFLRENS